MIIEALKRLWLRATAWWRRPNTTPSPGPAIVYDDLVMAGEDVDCEQQDKLEFHFREAILDELDMYFRTIRRLRTADPDAYALYAKLGAHIMPRTAVAAAGEVSSWFNVTRPAFGAVSVVSAKTHEDDADKSFYPRLLYFQKFNPAKSPVRWERGNEGDVYEVTLYYDDLKRGGVKAPACFAVNVSADGSIRPLRELTESFREIRVKKRAKDRHRGETFTVPVRSWKYPATFDEKHTVSDETITPIERMQRLFCIAANFYEGAAMGGTIRVDIARGDEHCVFSVDPRRTAYFFRDRGVVLNQNGNKKRIFHSVRPHKRKDRYIRLHFRGLREFAWNGYGVKISVPFRDHLHTGEFNAGAIEASRENRKEMYTMRQMATKLRKEMDAR